MVPRHWARWLPCRYMVKHSKSSSPEPRKLWGWILVYSIGDSRTIKLVQVIVVGFYLTFLRQGQICTPIHLYRMNVEKLFSQYILKTNGWNVQRMIKEVKLFSYRQNVLPHFCTKKNTCCGCSYPQRLFFFFFFFFLFFFFFFLFWENRKTKHQYMCLVIMLNNLKLCLPIGLLI